jgi:hypothetical protein
MMRSRAGISVGVPTGVFLLAFAVVAEGKPDFSGTWKMNPSKSEWGGMPAPDRMESTVEHSEPKLDVAVAQAGEWGEWSTDFTYTTDGSESVNSTPDFEVKSVVKWEGDVLVIASTMDFQGSPLTIMDRWTLSDDGMTLEIQRRMNGPMGEGDATIIMEKQ